MSAIDYVNGNVHGVMELWKEALKERARGRFSVHGTEEEVRRGPLIKPLSEK